MKKFVCKLLAVILLLGAVTGLMTACKKEPDKYSVRMTYQVSTAWPERKTIQGYLADPNGKHALTQDVPYVLLDVDGCPSVQVSIRFYIINETSPYRNVSYAPMEENEADRTEFGTSFYGYAIQQDDNQWKYVDPIHDIYDEQLPDQTFDYRNCYQLQRIPGLHRLKFRCPAFPYPHNPDASFTQDTIFTIDIHIKGDDRETVSLRAEESDDYTKLTDVDGRDLFIMKQGITAENKYLPRIGVYNQKGETVLNPMFPLFAIAPEPHIRGYFAKLNEYYPYLERSRDPNDWNLPYYPKTSGLYLASFTYTGDERYQPAEYLCYIVIP
ncbi:MAG: hypothetical protein HFK10_08180 [Clostridia bacterium]|jgi:hypothetical protein|nr:hypothetical protein [Clostridia bacterium]